MAVVATGRLADRPIGRTLATVAQRGFTGELVVTSGAATSTIRWRDGYVVGATGGHPADSAVKVALGAGLISSSKVGEVLAALGRAPAADDVSVVAEVGRLAPEHVPRLRRRVVANRAMRVFAYAEGELVLESEPAGPTPPEIVPIDARVIVYQGALAHLTDERLHHDVARLGHAFQLRPELGEALDAFGFGAAEAPVLDALAALSVSPTTLVQAAPEVDPRVSLAVLYAVAMWGYAEPIGGRAATTTAPPVSAAVTSAAAASAPAPSAPAPANVTPPPASTPRRGATRRTRTGAVDASAIRALVSERLERLAARADHFELLGVRADAAPDEIRRAYFDIARQLHPDRITAVGLEDLRADAQRVFAQINAAFGVLSHPKRRAEYEDVLRAGGEGERRLREDEAEATAERLLAAEEHFQRGEVALRRHMFPAAVAEARAALELNPDEGAHHALWAWATWNATIDKGSVLAPVRAALARAIELAPKDPTGFLYLGKVARAEGEDHEAQRWLKQALAIAPSHAEAAAEARIVELRLKGTRKPATRPPPLGEPTPEPPAPSPSPATDDKKKGLFSRFKR